MERFVWKAKILPGKIDEYIKRHSNIWPEMTEALNNAGIQNYSIWNKGNEVFGYYECEDLLSAQKAYSEYPAVYRWKRYMEDVMVMETSSENQKPLGFIQVFFHK